MLFEQKIKLIPILSCVFAATISSVLIVIWLCFPSLKEFSSTSMKFNTAVCVLASSISLWLLKEDSPRLSLNAQRWGYFFALIPLVIGLATAGEYIFKINLNIDELIVTDFCNAESSLFPGRMSPNASLCFILLGTALLLINKQHFLKMVHPASFFIVPLFLVCVLAIIGYFYSENKFYQVGNFIRIAWQTAFCGLILCVGILFARPKDGPVQIVSSQGLGGMTARRLFPIVVIVPFALGLVWLMLRRGEIVDRKMGVSVFVLLIIVIFGCVVGYISTRLDRLEREGTEQLEGALRARDEFLSIASHELKTPLTSLKLQAQIFKRRAGAGDEKAYAKENVDAMADQLEKQVSRLNRLVDDMLDIARIRAGKLTIESESFNLADLVNDVLMRMSPQFSAAKVNCPRVVKDSNTFGTWDKLRIEQVLINLFTNALRYGNGKPVEVSLDSKKDKVLLSVKDYGIGIAAENQTKIFDRFDRAENAAAVSGLGLGLFIAKQIVKSHGGNIWVESKLGEGSTFIVELPKRQNNNLGIEFADV